MEVKICGLTRPQEAKELNAAGADYAGFVFFAPSKRNVTIAQAKDIMAGLDDRIKKVAVMVSPEVELIEQVQQAGFDILQVHKQLSYEVLERARIPVWYAVNIADTESFQEKTHFLGKLPQELQQKITGIVVDGADYGSGKTFDWEHAGYRWRDGAETSILNNRKFILAGGLTADNVQEGIRMFSPDIVDVSSGVEGAYGKDADKINQFIGKVRDDE